MLVNLNLLYLSDYFSYLDVEITVVSEWTQWGRRRQLLQSSINLVFSSFPYSLLLLFLSSLYQKTPEFITSYFDYTLVYAYMVPFWSFSHFRLLLYVKKMNKVSSMLFFVDILISHLILGLKYRVLLKIWSKRCCELTLKNEFQLLKSLVSFTFLINANCFVLHHKGLYFTWIILTLWIS